jgi:BirA family transcriptional regulator, biotin operon repressor / biotin---[acetyl-CoA-carboxylase] ligase
VDPDAKRAKLTQNLANSSTRFSDIRWLAECGSTNTVLVDEARSSSELLPAAVLVTDRQSAGKGRLGRTWEAPVGSSLAMSFRVPLSNPQHAVPADHVQIIGLLPLAIGLAARRTALQLGVDPARIELKWPNDLMNPESGRKYAGILCEAVTTTMGTQVVIGVGMNLTRPDVIEGVTAERAQWMNETTLDMGPTLRTRTLATRSSLNTGPLDQVNAATVLAGEVDRTLAALAQSPAGVLQDVRQHCATVGRSIAVEQVNETWEGIAIGIDDGGALRVKRGDTGLVVVVHAGDVVHLRSTP